MGQSEARRCQLKYCILIDPDGRGFCHRKGVSPWSGALFFLSIYMGFIPTKQLPICRAGGFLPFRGNQTRARCTYPAISPRREEINAVRKPRHDDAYTPQNGISPNASVMQLSIKNTTIADTTVKGPIAYRGKHRKDTKSPRGSVAGGGSLSHVSILESGAHYCSSTAKSFLFL
ncbi:hypothetical protein F4679DRAFT_114618 [Xylaria curta]|nr:hypothetical protein F4679DRAFT_114618 [Xylaria curta]